MTASFIPVKRMEYYLFVLIYLSNAIVLNTQNLVANGGFEDVNICEEFNAKCAPEAWFRIPPTEVNVNTKKVNTIYEGDYSEIIVIENEKYPKTYRVFLYTMLLCPLVENQEYLLSFYLNPIFQDEYQLDVLFSKEELITGIINPFDFKPSEKIKGKVNKKKTNQWQLIEVNYKAKGGEQYLTFGNFNQVPFIFSKKDQVNNNQGDLIYLIDNVSLLPKDVRVSDCDVKRATDLLYNSNHRHTYKRGINKKIEPIKELETATPLLRKENEMPVLELVSNKKIEISDIIFEFDKYSIKPESINLLDSIISIIQDFDPQKIELVGHTDNIGSEVYNLELSMNRAKAIERYILQQFVEYEGEIFSIGKGESEFKVDNSTAANRAINRRVEILLSK